MVEGWIVTDAPLEYNWPTDFYSLKEYPTFKSLWNELKEDRLDKDGIGNMPTHIYRVSMKRVRR